MLEASYPRFSSGLNMDLYIHEHPHMLICTHTQLKKKKAKMCSLEDIYLVYMKPWVQSPVSYKLGGVVQTYNPGRRVRDSSSSSAIE